MSIELYVERLSPDAKLPKRATLGSAGYDLFSAVNCTIPERGRCLVNTYISLILPEGHYGRIAPRSGLALNKGIDVGAGVIDPDYTGSIGIVLFNHSDKKFVVNVGDRIAQLVLEKCSTPQVKEWKGDNNKPSRVTLRGTAGFGSTGIDSCTKKKVDENAQQGEQ